MHKLTNNTNQELINNKQYGVVVIFLDIVHYYIFSDYSQAKEWKDTHYGIGVSTIPKTIVGRIEFIDKEERQLEKVS